MAGKVIPQEPRHRVGHRGHFRGAFPTVESLLVLAGYAVLFTGLAVRCFRWE